MPQELGMTESAFRDNLLEGKAAFVTGGGSGICKGIAHAFMAHGADCAIVGRKADRLEAAAKELSEATGRTCVPVSADVRDPQAVEAALDAVLGRLGRLDIVVNGAAGNFLCPASQLSYNGFKTVIEIDTVGTYNVSKAAFDKYLRDHGGHILNISATLHYAATPLQIHASAAKAAIDSMTRTLAVEWGSLGIRVNGIAPGPIGDTEGMRRLAPGDTANQMLQAIPIGRMGRIEDIANLALFLVSPAASLIHGETVVADGGAWLGFAAGVRMG
jgi:2,4-dienoyl-CoA reductase [(3E)-enoyl-CoA-producing], peroxisomal